MIYFRGVVTYCVCLLLASSLALAVPAEADLRSPQDVMLGADNGSGSVGLPAGTRVKLLKQTEQGWQVSCYSLEFVVPTSELEFVKLRPQLDVVQPRPCSSAVFHNP